MGFAIVVCSIWELKRSVREGYPAFEGAQSAICFVVMTQVFAMIIQAFEIEFFAREANYLHQMSVPLYKHVFHCSASSMPLWNAGGHLYYSFLYVSCPQKPAALPGHTNKRAFKF
jgi:hypothetical protein